MGGLRTIQFMNIGFILNYLSVKIRVVQWLNFLVAANGYARFLSHGHQAMCPPLT